MTGTTHRATAAHILHALSHIFSQRRANETADFSQGQETPIGRNSRWLWIPAFNRISR